MMPPDVESLNLSYDDVLGAYEWREVVDEYNDLVAEVKRLREQIRLAKEWVDAYASHDSLSREDFSKHIGDD